MSDSAQKIWFYANSENQPTGPVSMEELQQLAASGEIALETFVTREGDPEWRTFEIASLPPVPKPLPISKLPPLPSISDERKWWYADQNKQQVGPITLDELVRLRNSGAISNQTLAFKKGHDEWEPFTVAVAFEEGITTWPEPLPPPLHGRELKKLGGVGRVAQGGADCVGMVLGVLGILLGAMLCATILGAIIGVPMILGSLAMMGMGTVGVGCAAVPPTLLNAPCPYCGYKGLAVLAMSHGSDCPACKKRFVIRDKKFLKVE